MGGGTIITIYEFELESGETKHFSLSGSAVLGSGIYEGVNCTITYKVGKLKSAFKE